MKRFLIYASLFILALDVTSLHSDSKVVEILTTDSVRSLSGATCADVSSDIPETTSNTATGDAYGFCPPTVIPDTCTLDSSTIHYNTTVSDCSTTLFYDESPQYSLYTRTVTETRSCNYTCPPCEPAPPPEGLNRIRSFSNIQECQDVQANYGTYTYNSQSYTNLTCYSSGCDDSEDVDLFGKSSQCPANSTYNDTTSKCECNDGYTDPSGTGQECFPTNCGVNMSFDGSSCQCDEGFTRNDVFDESAGCSKDTSNCQTCDELASNALNNCPSPKVLTFDCTETNGCGTVADESCKDPLSTCEQLRAQAEPYCLPPSVFVWECEDTPAGANVTKDQCHDPDNSDSNTSSDPDNSDSNTSNNDPLLDATNETNKNLNDILNNSVKIKDSLEDISSKTDSLVSNTDSMKQSLSDISSDIKTSNSKLSSIDSKLNTIDSSIKTNTDAIVDGLFSDVDPFADVDMSDGSDNFGEYQGTISSNFGILNNGDFFGLSSVPTSSLPTFQVSLYGQTQTFFEPSMMNNVPIAEIRGLLFFFAALVGFVIVFKTI